MSANATISESPIAVVCDVTVKSPSGVLLNLKQVPEDEAKARLASVKAEHGDDPQLIAVIAECERSFGFIGINRGEYAVSTYSRILPVDTGEKTFCMRRLDMSWWNKPKETTNEEWYAAMQRHAASEPQEDSWKKIGGDRVCTYCGSLHPGDLIKLLDAHGLGIIDPSDKGYKWYLRRPGIRNAGFGAIKYYRQHDTPELLAKLAELTVAVKGGAA